LTVKKNVSSIKHICADGETYIEELINIFFERSGYPVLIYNKRELATTITCARSTPPHSLGCKGYRTISKLITHLDFAQL
jgi:hypothetical protein